MKLLYVLGLALCLQVALGCLGSGGGGGSSKSGENPDSSGSDEKKSSSKKSSGSGEPSSTDDAVQEAYDQLSDDSKQSILARNVTTWNNADETTSHSKTLTNVKTQKTTPR